MSDNTSIPLYNISNTVKIEDLFELQFIPFKCDWFAEPLNIKTAFLLAYSSQRIYFAFKCRQKAFINSDHQKNAYKEGLWKYDVAEFFICDPKSGQYQEFNISPSGSWWTMLFSGYRKEDHSHFVLPQEIEIISNFTDSIWEVAFSVALDQLSLDVSDLTKLTGNVTSIINGRNRKYLSWAIINSDKPDFHRNDCFLPFYFFD